MFFIRMRVEVFYIQIQFTCKILLLFFLIKTMIYWKKTLYIEKKNVVHTWRPRNLSRWNNVANDIHEND